MADVVLAVDVFHGEDTDDITGRIPDGGDEPTSAPFAIGLWNRNPALNGTTTVGIRGNKAVALNGTDGFWGTYSLHGITGLNADQAARLTGKFNSLGVNASSQMLAVGVRYDPTRESAYELDLYGDGNWYLFYAEEGSYSTLISGTLDTPPVEGEEHVISICAQGPILRVFHNDVRLGCAVDGRGTAGDPGLALVDLLGDGTGVEVTHFEVSAGCPGEGGPLGSLEGFKNLLPRDSTAPQVQKNLAPREVRGAWTMLNQVWRPMFDSTGGEPAGGDCGRKTAGGPVYSLVMPTFSSRILGPDGAANAAIDFDLIADTRTPREAAFPGGIMAALSPDSSLMYVPGRLGAGLNRFDLGANLVDGFALPVNPYGVAAPAPWYALVHGDATLGAGMDPFSTATFFWRDPTMTGSPQSLTQDYWNIRGGGGGIPPIAGHPTWFFDYQSTCPSSPVPLAGTSFTVPTSGDPADPAPVGFNGYPGQLPRDSFTGGNVIPGAVYLANYLSIHLVTIGASTQVHIRYGVLYSTPSGGIQRKDWLNQFIFPNDPCPGYDTGLLPTGTVAVAGVDYHARMPSLYVSAQDTGALYALDELVGNVAAVWDTGLTRARGVASDAEANPYVVGVGLSGLQTVGRVVHLAREDGAILWSTDVGTDPHSVLYVAGTLYVSDVAEGKVYALNGATGAVLGAATVGFQPHDLALNGAGELYVTNTGSASVSVIKPDDLRVDRTLYVRTQPWGLVWDEDRQVMWVSHIGSNDLTAIPLGTESQFFVPPTTNTALNGPRFFMGYGYYRAFGQVPFKGSIVAFGEWSLGDLSNAQDNDCRVILAQGGYTQFKTNNVFDIDKYAAWIAGLAHLEPALKVYWDAGVLVGAQCMDDIDVTNWTGGISPSQIDQIAGLWKTYFPWIRVYVRAKPSQLGTGPFTYLDACGCQFSYYEGDPTDFRDREVALAQSQGLGLWLALNITDGGPARGHGRGPMTAAQITYAGSIFANTPQIDGMAFWKYPPTGTLPADVNQAILDLLDIMNAMP